MSGHSGGQDTAAERMSRYRRRKKRHGLVPVTVYVRKLHMERVRQYAARLNKPPKPKGRK
jgi:hypothetical protein